MNTPTQYLRHLVLVFLIVSPVAFADALGEAALRQSLRDLGNDYRMMCVAAHPDDEDGATLAYYRKKYGIETHAAIATRGEGGQNEIGPELYNALGVIRTREMRAAAAIEGAELHFLDLPEFGFSKTLEETQAVWGAENTLERMVRVIRETQPHVIITHHGRMKDHGHHQAIGAAVIEAFDVAGDPTVFPEHREAGFQPWQPHRLYIRDFGGNPETASVTVDISELHEPSGMTYAEIAAAALTVHESQGMFFFIDRLLSGRPKAYYDLVKEAVPEDDRVPRAGNDLGAFFAGLPFDFDSWRRAIAESDAGRRDLKPAAMHRARLDRENRDRSARNWRLWEKANRAAAAATQFRLSAEPSDDAVVPGQPVRLELELVDFSGSR